MSTAAPLQNAIAKPQQSSNSGNAGLLLQRKCACGSPTSSLTGECEQCKSKSGLRAKLTVGATNDPLEQEADRVADQVLAAPAHSAVSAARPRIQRYTGQATGQADTAPASVDRVLTSLGRPLDPMLRQDMEQRFGHDFSWVRIHSGGAAEQSVRDVNANAYTVGHNIVFGAGRFAPGTQVGRRLLAHELTHVVQQQMGDTSADAEARARAVASGVIAGHTVAPGMFGGAAYRLQADNKSITEEQPSHPVSPPGLKLTLDVLDKFQHNSATLTEEHRRRVALLAIRLTELLKNVPGGTIRLTGHTDTSGEEKYNQKLGQDRADAAIKVLLFELSRLAVSPAAFRIGGDSRGETEPVVATGDNVRNEYNRRVEVQFQASPLSLQLPPYPPSATTPKPIPDPDLGQGPIPPPPPIPKPKETPVEVTIKATVESEESKEKGEKKQERSRNISVEVVIPIPKVELGKAPVLRAPIVFFGKLNLEVAGGAKSETPGKPGEAIKPQGYGEFKPSVPIVSIEKEKILLPLRPTIGFDLSAVGSVEIKKKGGSLEGGGEANLELKVPFSGTPLFFFGKGTGSFICVEGEDSKCSFKWGVGAGIGSTFGGEPKK